jgi:GT2 family glycosyltransferase
MHQAASIIVITYGRELVLVDCLQSLVPCLRGGDEILVIDQTPGHDAATQVALDQLAANPAFRFARLEIPSVPAARNLGLRQARNPIAIFVDDDVLVTDPDFVSRHVRYYDDPDVGAVAGAALLPDCRPFFAPEGGDRHELCGVNMSLRQRAIEEIGGFDENYYSTLGDESDVAYRLVRAGWKIARGGDVTLVHRAESEGGCSNRQRSDAWFYQTYHNYMYQMLKRPLWSLPFRLTRYAFGSFRRDLFPGYRTLVSPSFFFGVLLAGHWHGCRTRWRRRHDSSRGTARL